MPLHFQDREENTQLDYGSLRENGYPAGAFKSELLSPTEPFPHYSQPAPVLTVTANFVRGGLLLAVFFHHGVSDGHSVARFIELLARCTRAKSGQSIPDGLSLADLWVGRLEETLGLSTLGKEFSRRTRRSDNLDKAYCNWFHTSFGYARIRISCRSGPD